jgi:hypothetical protein
MTENIMKSLLLDVALWSGHAFTLGVLTDFLINAKVEFFWRVSEPRPF